jgi:hypothetical protein
MDRINFIWLIKTPHDDLLKEVAVLPPRSAIFPDQSNNPAPAPYCPKDNIAEASPAPGSKKRR